LKRLSELTQPLSSENAPVDKDLPGQVRREIQWIEPKLVAQVDYGWTSDRALRLPRYLGLREEKASVEAALTRQEPRHASRNVGTLHAVGTKEAAPPWRTRTVSPAIPGSVMSPGCRRRKW
jgi:ATP-dependent DNA ligase